MSLRTSQKRARRGGFALIIVILLVALVAIGAASLLDLVNIDLRIVGEQSKIAKADDAANGALSEVMGHQDFKMFLPLYDAPNLEYDYVGKVGTNFVWDPNNVNGVQANIAPASSEVVAHLGDATYAQGYEATARLLRRSRALDTRLDSTFALIYEIEVRSEVGGGTASREIRAQAYQFMTVPIGTKIPQRHAR